MWIKRNLCVLLLTKTVLNVNLIASFQLFILWSYLQILFFIQWTYQLLHEFSSSPHIDLDLDDSSKHWPVSVARTTAFELSKFDPLLYTLTKDSVDVGIRVSMVSGTGNNTNDNNDNNMCRFSISMAL